MAGFRQNDKTALTSKKPKPFGSALFLCPLLIGLLLTFCIFQCGCLPDWLKSTLEPIPTGIDSGFSIDTSTDQHQTAASTGKKETVAPTKAPVIDFNQTAGQLLLEGLQKRQKEIKLDAAIQPNAIKESSIKETIDQIYKLYQNIYNLHPEFFYLDGSINVSYTILQGETDYLNTMTIKPQYWSATRDLNETELARLIDQIENIVGQLAGKIRQQTNEPWEQLLLAHDYLVQNVAYDSSSNQDNNQVISALLKGVTLCQGYAQTFQLIGQRLGFDVRLISGKSDGIGHAWNLVSLDGKFYHIDVTHDDPLPDGGSLAPAQHIHFLRSDAMMQETHQWSTQDYPACPSDGATYYRQAELLAANQTELKQKLQKFIKTIDYNVKEANLLELLFTGKDLPDQASLEKMLKASLEGEVNQVTVFYRAIISKRIITIEITPDS